MTREPASTWLEANQRYLMACLRVVQEALKDHAAKGERHPVERNLSGEPATGQTQVREAAELLTEPASIDVLAASFGLSRFERNVLLLCAGMELDSSFAGDCAAAQGDPNRRYPTFSLALAALAEAHWSALVPSAPLRYWRMIRIDPGHELSTSPLRIDERILHYLTGIHCPDEHIQEIAERVEPPGEAIPSHRPIVERIAGILSRGQEARVHPVIQLCGNDQGEKPEIAASGCVRANLRLHSLRAGDIPTSPSERATFGRLWEREAILGHSALLIDYDEIDNPEIKRCILSLVEGLQGPVFLAVREPMKLSRRPTLCLEVQKPDTKEQKALWVQALGEDAWERNGMVDRLVSQFNLNGRTIERASHEALGLFRTTDSGNRDQGSRFGDLLWDVCRLMVRPRLDQLAQRIEPVPTWEDLVLPESQKQILREIAIHVRQRTQVYDGWGFAGKSQRGLGVSALFTGESGTGKTMASEVLANELRLDLYRIDLSQVVSKYIGETEKNLRQVFDAAEEGGAILLFDEADALFGKRSEVKDSHDRYANIEVSYLLQRMEAYRGLAILTTNMKSALDAAFLRRLRFVVQFPFPNSSQRQEIWQRIFPAGTPVQGLDVTKLARLNVAGGNIRNIAMYAAFLAADARSPVTMGHLLGAARAEYGKLEKPLSAAEIAGWQ